MFLQPRLLLPSRLFLPCRPRGVSKGRLFIRACSDHSRYEIGRTTPTIVPASGRLFPIYTARRAPCSSARKIWACTSMAASAEKFRPISSDRWLIIAFLFRDGQYPCPIPDIAAICGRQFRVDRWTEEKGHTSFPLGRSRL